jgi:hypothetical protein
VDKPLDAYASINSLIILRFIVYTRHVPTERIFNIFLYFDDGVATEYGVRHHQVAGEDQAKMAFLLAHVDEDSQVARRFRLPRRFTPEEWLAAPRLGQQLGYFEEAFQNFRAPAAPVYCLTCILGGVPVVERRIEAQPYRGDIVTAEEGAGAVPDYLVHYTTGNIFRFAELMNDDYFEAIKVLFNAGHYVSCAKLLMSCVDTPAFVEFGDARGNFAAWLDAYVDLKPHGISSEELWEFRNSVLHMTNLKSRKVISGHVSPIMLYVGGPRSMPPISPNLPKPFNLRELINSIAEGIGRWAEALNTDREKILKFIERYDLTISDNRVARVPYNGTVDDIGR